MWLRGTDSNRDLTDLETAVLPLHHPGIDICIFKHASSRRQTILLAGNRTRFIVCLNMGLVPRVLVLHRIDPAFLAVRGLDTASTYLQRRQVTRPLRLPSASQTAADIQISFH